MTKLDNKDLKNVFWRSHFLQASWNYERMQALGYAWIVEPALKKIYGEDEEGYKKALTRNLEFFNTNPYMAPPIIGISLAMEEEKANNIDTFDESVISATKISLMGPLAGIGDSLFWFTVYPIALSIGISLATTGNYFGLLVYLLIINIPRFIVFYFGLREGYKRGTKIFDDVESSNIMQRISEGATIVGLMVLGVMIATMINVPLDFVVGKGEQAMPLQQIFDSIMPNLIPLVLTFVVAKLMKKGHSANKILITIILICILLAFFGLF